MEADVRADITLIERIVARDERAVGELYDRHSRLLFGLILRVLRDRGEAEEVLQEVFVLVWTKAETYNVALGSPAAWLVRVARNRAIDRLRSNAVRLRAVESAPGPEPSREEDPEVRATLSEQQRAVAGARFAAGGPTRADRGCLLPRPDPIGTGGEIQIAARHREDTRAERHAGPASPAGAGVSRAMNDETDLIEFGVTSTPAISSTPTRTPITTNSGRKKDAV